MSLNFCLVRRSTVWPFRPLTRIPWPGLACNILGFLESGSALPAQNQSPIGLAQASRAFSPEESSHQESLSPLPEAAVAKMRTVTAKTRWVGEMLGCIAFLIISVILSGEFSPCVDLCSRIGFDWLTGIAIR